MLEEPCQYSIVPSAPEDDSPETTGFYWEKTLFLVKVATGIQTLRPANSRSGHGIVYTYCMKLRDYRLSDEQKVFSLWKTVLGSVWPVDEESFRYVLFGNPFFTSGDHLVAEVDNRVVGFIGTQTRDDKIAKRRLGEVAVVLVAPDCQRKGIGATLVNKALDHFKQKKLRSVQLGGGGYSYFWPGVPKNLPGAIKFFLGLDFEYTEESVDLVCNLREYTTPKWVYERTNKVGISIEVLERSDAPKLLEFEEENFSNWYHYFGKRIEDGRQEEIVVAKDKTNQIVGSAIYSTGKPKEAKFSWKLLLGEEVGDFGAVGVSEKNRGKGIGLALSARCSELLKERGVRNCFIGWTWLVDWYGKLGYRVWRTYKMSTMEL